MRKLFIFLFLSISFMATAQTKLGFRGGMNFSQFVFRPEYSGDKKGAGILLTRLNAGLQIEIPLNEDDNWFIYTGPYYAGKGNRIRTQRPIQPFDTIVTKLNYIELPVSIGYKFNEGGKNRFISGIGIFAGYGFKGEILYYKDPDRTRRNLHKIDKPYKRIDMGFNVMAAYEINHRYGIRLDYSRSLFDISRHKWKETNNTFGFSFFWYLSNKNKIAD